MMLNKYGRPEYSLRKSQQEASDAFINYALNTADAIPTFCFNAVMRWGKCLTALTTVYNFNNNLKVIAENKQIKNVLILTFFPAVEDSWSRLFKDGVEAQEKFDNFNFISLSNKNSYDPEKVNVYFSSFQEIYTGKDKKNIFYEHGYDLIILDEYHYGAYNKKARENLKAFNTDADVDSAESVLSNPKLKFKYKLVLTGTPYKLFMQTDEFSKNKGNLFRFTYFDEQRDKLENGIDSDYKSCPQLNLYSVSIKKDSIKLFDKIDCLLSNKDFFNPTSRLSMFKKSGAASFWLIDSIKDANKIEDYINEKYPNQYNVINLYSKGYSRPLEAVNESLRNNRNKFSIILSYNKLTLGVTIPEIESVVFLRDITTAELYMQAACRSKSQYSDKSKDISYIVSFDIENDYSIFRQVTQQDVTEKEFIQLFPLKFVEYDPKDGSTLISEISDTSLFLDALSKVPVQQLIRNSVSKKVKCIDDIPADLRAALYKISSIGTAKTDNEFSKEADDIAKDPVKLAESKGKKVGRRDQEDGKAAKCPVMYSDPIQQAAFEKGYSAGYNTELKEAKTHEEKAEAESANELIMKIQILISRFIYIMIGDYYRENKFPDIKSPKIPESFFQALLGFDKDLFIRLYDEFILDNEYVDATITTIRNKESKNTNYLALNQSNDFTVTDLMEIKTEDIIKRNNESVAAIVNVVDDLLETDKSLSIAEKNEEPIGQKYIYIAKPSEFLKGLIGCFVALRSYLNRDSEMYDKCQKYIDYFTNIVKGVKIGETHRKPTARLEELNGYTKNTGTEHLLFDVYDYVAVDEDKSDVEFHKYLEERGYIRIKDDVRKEFFEIQPHIALNLLRKYSSTEDEIGFSKMTYEEIEKLNLTNEYINWLKNK